MKLTPFNLLQKVGKIYQSAYLVLIFLTLACSSSTLAPIPAPVVTPVVTPIITPALIPDINTSSTTAKEIIADMATGFNLGNTFDNNLNTPTFESVKPIIDLYYTGGMRHVRIPVTWMQGFSSNLADANGNVNTAHPRLLELKAIVDYALAKKMYVEINAHHEHWLKDNYDGSANYDTKFSNLWKGIATFFKDAPKQLIFDVLNEPDGAMGQWSGNFPIPTGTQQLSLTRQINKVAYDAIRATGGNNTTRIIMVEPNGQGNQGMIASVYPDKANLPGGGKDAYLAFQVHTYDPWSFCGQTGANSSFPGNTTIESAIKKVGTHSTLVDVPVNYGEFGVGRTAGTERNTDVVRGYYKLVRTTCLAQKMSLTAWDDRGWFGLITKSGTDYTFSNSIVPTMMAQ